jgi:chromosomal replication initiator protein
MHVASAAGQTGPEVGRRTHAAQTTPDRLHEAAGDTRAQAMHTPCTAHDAQAQPGWRHATHTFSARFAKAGNGPADGPLEPCYVRPAGPPQGPRSIAFPLLPPPRRTAHAPVIDDEHPSCWRFIRAEMQRAVSESTWHQWLEPLSARALRENTLVVEAPEAIRPWVEQRFGRLLQACTAAVVGPGVRVDLVAPGSAVSDPALGRTTEQDRAVSFNPRHTFEQFVIGDSNRLAHAAALAVAEMPGLAYNPLFICGPPGLGKTHLLHSIANYVTAYGGGTTIRYTTAEAFTNHFLGALHGHDVESFKAAYRGVDVLLVDDVQFLQAKARTEQEFFHTFNALHEAGAQIVLTSDRLPHDLGELETRLRERFEAGLVTDVRAPDASTRLTILRKRVQQDGVGGLDPAALELIAARVTDNVRALEGALIRVVAYSSLTGRPVTAELTAEVLDGLYPDRNGRARAMTVREIQEQTAGAFGVTVEALVSASRVSALAWPRQVAMYLARELTDQTLPAIGRAFGGRNHTTVLHAYKRTAERIAGDPDAFETVRRLTESLREPGVAS